MTDSRSAVAVRGRHLLTTTRARPSGTLTLLWLLTAAAISCAHVSEETSPAQDLPHPWDDRLPLLQAANPAGDTQQTTDATAKFFQSMDDNGDGQIEAAEAVAFVSASLQGDEQFDTAEEVNEAVREFMQGMDGIDPDPFISLDEFAEQQPHMLQGSRLIDWVRHGLQLPQYAENFRDNGITIHDFPLLAGPDGMEILKEDMHVASKLHREKILRSIRRQMLGLGHPPSAPEGVTCIAVTCSSIVLNWEPPKEKGNPPFHKYVVERRIQLEDGWRTVAATDADDTQLVIGDLSKARSYEFRVTAWSAITHSPYGQSGPCRIDPSECVGAPGSPAPGGADSEEGGRQWSFWVWFNTLVSVGVYSLVFFLKHVAGQDTALAENMKRGVGNLRTWGIQRFGSLQLGDQRLDKRTGTPELSTSVKSRGGAAVSQWDSPYAAGGGSPSNSLSRLSPARPGVLFEGQVDQELEPAEGDSVLPPLSPIYPQGFPRELVASPAKFWDSPPPEMNGASELHTSFSAMRFPRPASVGDRLDGYDTDSSPSVSKRGHMSQQAEKGSSKAQAEGAHGMRRINSSSRIDPPKAEDRGYNRSSDPEDKLSRFRCHHPACHRVWNNWASVTHLKRMATSHYCGSCQRTFCAKHTRVSPHGNMGSCAIESNCYCYLCYARMAPEVQAKLEATNRLPLRPDAEGMISPEGSRRRGEGSAAAQSATSSHDGDDRQPEDLEVEIAARQRSVANWAKARAAVLPSRRPGKPPVAPQPQGGPPGSRMNKMRQQQSPSPSKQELQPTPTKPARAASPFWKRRQL